jgi:hypothetical protein
VPSDIRKSSPTLKVVTTDAITRDCDEGVSKQSYSYRLQDGHHDDEGDSSQSDSPRSVQFSDEVTVFPASMEPEAVEARSLSTEVKRRLTMHRNVNMFFAECDDETADSPPQPAPPVENVQPVKAKYPQGFFWASIFFSICSNGEMCA